MGRDHSSVPQLGFPHHEGGASIHAPAAMGPRHQHWCTLLIIRAMMTTNFILLWSAIPRLGSNWPVGADRKCACSLCVLPLFTRMLTRHVSSRSRAARALLSGSMHSLVASPYKSAYNAAKHGIAGFTKTVALETAQVRFEPTSVLSRRDALR